MFNRLVFLIAASLLACTASAETWTFKGQIVEWPAGKTGVLKMYPGADLRYIPVGAISLLETQIDSKGQFILTLPKEGIKATLTKEFLLLGDPKTCQHQSKSQAVRVVPMTFVIFNSKGQNIDNLEISIPGDPPQTLSVFYASQSANLSAVCGVDRSMVLSVQIKTGWNLLILKQNSSGVMLNSVKQLPEGVIWESTLHLKYL
ncbi:hypothetical protein [Deinococcus roseus]|uniref:Carboxypeptidase regulatory-like domain-containing protein n=1 Tax=Deinococcus roseus TaxID=392414 RepID=A0ABQ2DE42_9DEIO|nr:hypothetical protein [Deinococcus roseus]GGJ52558.1 hypothetical protein GCM10008938_43180 [Deinococcus roseus]